MNRVGFMLSRKQCKIQNYIDDKLNKLDAIPYQADLIRDCKKQKTQLRLKFKEKKDRYVLGSGFYGNRVKINKDKLLLHIETYKQMNLVCDSLDILEKNVLDEVLWMQIKSIEKSENLTMDFIIPETHSFITNGIISHNTPFTKTDLYSKLRSNKTWKLFEYPGIMPDGSITNPNRFDLKYYTNKKEELGTPVFSREILCQPISDQSSIFPYEYLNRAYINMQDLRLVDNRLSYPVKFKKVTVGCDFAISGGIGADYSVFTVLGCDDLDNYHIIYLYRGKGKSHQEQISQIQNINHNFNPDVIVMEDNGFQKVMIELAEQAGLRNIQPFHTTGFSKKDSYNGLPSLSAMFERGQIKMPRGDERSKQTTDLICAELNSVTYNLDSGKLESTDDHDDTAMSLFFAIKGMTMMNSNININYI